MVTVVIFYAKFFCSIVEPLVHAMRRKFEWARGRRRSLLISGPNLLEVLAKKIELLKATQYKKLAPNAWRFMY